MTSHSDKSVLTDDFWVTSQVYTVASRLLRISAWREGQSLGCRAWCRLALVFACPCVSPRWTVSLPAHLCGATHTICQYVDIICPHVTSSHVILCQHIVSMYCVTLVVGCDILTWFVCHVIRICATWVDVTHWHGLCEFVFFHVSVSHQAMSRMLTQYTNMSPCVTRVRQCMSLHNTWIYHIQTCHKCWHKKSICQYMSPTHVNVCVYIIYQYVTSSHVAQM